MDDDIYIKVLVMLDGLVVIKMLKVEGYNIIVIVIYISM